MTAGGQAISLKRPSHPPLHLPGSETAFFIVQPSPRSFLAGTPPWLGCIAKAIISFPLPIMDFPVRYIIGLIALYILFRMVDLLVIEFQCWLRRNDPDELPERLQRHVTEHIRKELDYREESQEIPSWCGPTDPSLSD